MIFISGQDSKEASKERDLTRVKIRAARHIDHLFGRPFLCSLAAPHRGSKLLVSARRAARNETKQNNYNN